jgi:arylsulfatase A-like enzyme
MPGGRIRSDPRRALGLVVLSLFVVVLVVLLVSRPDGESLPTPSLPPPTGPNVVVILTDDQRYDTLHVMPEVQRLLVERGMSLERAIATDPLCCPSRATFLTGRYAHTTGVYANGGPDGGWERFRPSESSTIATALHDAGYRTALIGKYLNGYGVRREPYVPPGWDEWLAFTNGNGEYFDYTMYDGERGDLSFGSRPREYSTDVIGRRAVSFIRGVPEGRPLFLMVTPYAPHAGFHPAPRHEGTLASAPVPLGPAVNEADVSDKPLHIRVNPIEPADELRRRTRAQWETLLAVDQLVGDVLAALRDTGRAGDTLVIFASDNGFANREHRWISKLVPYEESIRIPMVIRLPGTIAPGATSQALVSNVDIAPTIADFAGVSFPMEGVSLRPLLSGTAPRVRDEVVLEHRQWGNQVPTYCGVRTRRFVFAHYVTGEEELYDLVRDPFELENLASERPAKANALRALTESLCSPVPPGFSWEAGG